MQRIAMKHYIFLTAIMLTVILGLFGLTEALKLPPLLDPDPWLQRGGLFAAVVGTSLLTADVLLPVPASLVMIAHGAIFGIWVGALLSLTGSLCAGLFGFFLGRHGGPLLDRVIPTEDRKRGDCFLAKWGDIAVIVTRPIPMLAETVAILAGTSSMTWQRMILASVAGSLPAAFLYALTGAVAISLNSTYWTFLLVILIAGTFWFMGRRLERMQSRHKSMAIDGRPSNNG